MGAPVFESGQARVETRVLNALAVRFESKGRQRVGAFLFRIRVLKNAFNQAYTVKRAEYGFEEYGFKHRTQ